MAPAKIIDRILEPVTGSLTPEVAERIVNSHLDAETQTRLDVLAGKADRGDLTDEEREEYEDFVEAIDFVGIIKAKARMVLAQQPS
jgi:hypothetical protein